MRYYVYGHYTKDTGDLFYIGKGTGNRAWMKNNRSKKWHEVVNSRGFTFKLLNENLESEEAIELERKLILENQKVLINRIIPNKVNTFTYEDINTMFYYDGDCSSGLRWKWDRLNSLGRLRPFKDRMAGSKNGRYWCVEYSGKSIPVHRLIYFLHNPDMDWNLDIDHINGDGFDNRIENLRLTTKSTNMRNRILPNSTGHSFVHLKESGRGRPHYYLYVPLKEKRTMFLFYFHVHGSKEKALIACLSKKESLKQELLDNGVSERAFYGEN